jgi:predicted secreted protein
LLYQDWDHSDNRLWVIFQKYLETFNNISVHQPKSPTDYIFNASLNGSQEKMKEFSSRQIKNKVLFNNAIISTHVQLRALLDERTSMVLMTMSRTTEAH